MKASGAIVLATALVAALATALGAQTPAPPARRGPAPVPSPAAVPPPVRPAPHREGELDCKACHVGKHQGIVHMYIGIGGRGTPTIPSHMLQVRVECIACHATPQRDAAGGGTSRTFKPSEQACLTCHGEKYRGMLGRWTQTLAQMTDIITPKLKATRGLLEAADRRDPKHTRASSLVDDAEFNLRYVTLAKGVHNVFYAADMLKLSNAWLDEASALLGKAPGKTDDRLVRGGYCAALCHEIARVKPRETVRFGKLIVPHLRHTTEFGATCTSCHSAETHKAVTATPATCSACHHSVQNERCEGCHRAQSAFFKGETETTLVKLEPDRMAAAVSCTGCHDWSRKHSRAAVGEKCVGCHEAQYSALLGEWTTGFDAELRKTADAIRRAEAALVGAKRARRDTAAAELLLKEAKGAAALVRTARPAHNPPAADALLQAARAKAAEALARAAQP